MTPLTTMSGIVLHIVYVMDDSNTYDQELATYCSNNRFRFTYRDFDSIKYSDDRNNIHDLPAIHIYTKHAYRTTIYPTVKYGKEGLFETIGMHVKEYEAAETKRIQRQKAWKESLMGFFKGFVKRNLQAEPTKITVNPMY